eukprot:TRINITY_DN11529_c0_g1_i1.p1 TRINITY_DN11529_c0_g1~~TRINITY_DN11529_c0_g1_i1.p1  ORF type:complete len:382 (+),score=148.86 TRINITY_DN11529_c0_g1_i1:51-1196(+)
MIASLAIAAFVAAACPVELTDQCLVQIILDPRYATHGIAVSADSSTVAVARADPTNTTGIYYVKNGMKKYMLDLGHAAFSVDFSKAKDTYLVGLSNYNVSQIDWHGELIYSDTTAGYYPFDCRYSPNDVTFSCASEGLQVWNATQGDVIVSKPGDRSYALAYSPDSQRVAIGSQYLVEYNVADGSLFRNYTDAPGTTRAIAFSPDGKLVVAAVDKVVVVYDHESGDMKEHLVGHTDSVTTVAYSPDGLLLASGSTDGTIRIWDAASWQTRLVLDVQDAVTDLEYTPDGQYLVSSCTFVHIWNATIPSSTPTPPSGGGSSSSSAGVVVGVLIAVIVVLAAVLYYVRRRGTNLWGGNTHEQIPTSSSAVGAVGESEDQNVNAF